MKGPSFFHYTSGQHLDRILADGFLRPSNAGAPAEVPLLWFSTNPTWEPTATKMVTTPRGVRRLTRDEQRVEFGCVRFALSTEIAQRLMPWDLACRYARTPRPERRAMEASGRRLGADPAHWFATADAVFLAEVDRIERLDAAGRWIDCAEVAE